MKNKLIGFIILGLFLLTIGIVSAHAPSSIMLSYDKNNNSLLVDVQHGVEESDTTHFIATVYIRVNEELVDTYNYYNQSSTSGDTFTYPVTANDGDTIDVAVYCSTGNSLMESLTLGATSGEDDDSTPGFEIILVISAIAIVFIIKRKKIV
jgi:hypothetical protein